MKIVQSILPDNKYFKDVNVKTNIVLHHTVSSSASSSIGWFNEKQDKVCTAYVIDKDGTVYELFNPKYWAFHLGIPKTNGKFDKKTIGIEIVNEGYLTKTDNGMTWFDGKAKYKGIPFEVPEGWRGNKYFASYPDIQQTAVAELCYKLCNEFDIPKRVQQRLDFNIQLAEKSRGIISHCNVRSDKTDISPAFDLKRLQEALNYLEGKV